MDALRPGKRKMQFTAYQRERVRIKNGDIVLYRGKGFISGLIKKITKSPYSHAGIVTWWNERLMVMEAVGRGVVTTPLSLNLKKYPDQLEWFTSTKPISEEKRLRMIRFAQEELGKEYAFLDLIRFGIKILFTRNIDKKDELRRSQKLICSHYVSQIYNSIGMDLKKNQSDRFMSPQDIASSPRLKSMGVIKL
jgi:hypothetical protein